MQGRKYHGWVSLLVTLTTNNPDCKTTYVLCESTGHGSLCSKPSRERLSLIIESDCTTPIYLKKSYTSHRFVPMEHQRPTVALQTIAATFQPNEILFLKAIVKLDAATSGTRNPKPRTHIVTMLEPLKEPNPKPSTLNPLSNRILEDSRT